MDTAIVSADYRRRRHDRARVAARARARGRRRGVGGRRRPVAGRRRAATRSTGARSSRRSPLDRTLINLNTGHHCSQPHGRARRGEALSRHGESWRRCTTRARSTATCETVRRGLAEEFGCDPEEMAITRNASESLQILQNGIDLAAGRRGHHDRAGLPAHADDVGPAHAARQDQGHARCSSRCRRPRTDAVRPVREGDHAADEGPALLPHHQPHRPALSGAAHLPHGARARHHDDRRRRARRRAVPVQAARPRVRRLRRQPAQVAARAVRHRHPVRPPRPDPEVLAAAGRAGAQRPRHPQVRGDRHGAGGDQGRDRRRARVPSGDRRRAQGRAARTT